MSTEDILNMAAIVFELGLPLALVVAYRHAPPLREKLVVVLGAITPLLFLYIGVVIAFVLDPDQPSTRFAFYGMWIMSAFFYVVCIIVGAIAAFVPRPQNLPIRFGIGFGTVAIAGLMLGVRWW